MRTSRWWQVVAMAAVAAGTSCIKNPNQCEVNSDQDGDHVISVACGGTDCDDLDAQRFPGNPEVCDVAGHDEDCDPTTFGVRDADGDSFADAACCNTDGGGASHCGNDCDDSRRGVNPNAPEVCDRIDNDCDTAIDEMVEVNLYTDADHDGYGTGTPTMGCFPSVGQSFLGNDCDDTKAAIVPGEMECYSTTEYVICDAQTGMFTTKAICPGNAPTCHTEPNMTGICL